MPQSVEQMQRVIELARVVRERHNRPVKTPLRELVVVHPDESFLSDIAGATTPAMARVSSPKGSSVRALGWPVTYGCAVSLRHSAGRAQQTKRWTAQGLGFEGSVTLEGCLPAARCSVRVAGPKQAHRCTCQQCFVQRKCVAW